MIYTHRCNKMNLNQVSANQSQPPVMRPTYFQQQLQRCYLCEQPKQDYTLIRSFSEIICRACLNYEGSERVEQLIAEARQSKGLAGHRTPGSGATPLSPASSIHEQMTQQQQHSTQAAHETIVINQNDSALMRKQQTNGDISAGVHIPVALRNNCYFLDSNEKTTTTTTLAARPERAPSIIDVESVNAAPGIEQLQRQDEPRTVGHHHNHRAHADPTQPPVTNTHSHLRRSLTRSSSPTIVLDKSNAEHNQQQKHRELRHASQKNQSIAVGRLSAARAKNVAAAAEVAADARQSVENFRPKDYCQSNECTMDNERSLSRSFGTSPPVMSQQHSNVARDATLSPPGQQQQLDRSSIQQMAAPRQTTKLNEYDHRQTMPAYPGSNNVDQMSRYQSSAAAAAAAAYYKHLDSMAPYAHDPESFHRIMQECNMYTPPGAPFYMHRAPHIPTANQQSSAHANRNHPASDAAGRLMAATTANDNNKQAGGPANLYGQTYIPMTMTSYMTPNGPILCPSQYGPPPPQPPPPPPPYHPHQLIRPAGTMGMVRAPGPPQYITGSNGAIPTSYGPATSAPPPPSADKRPPNGSEPPFDQDNYLRNLLTSTQPVDYNPPLSLMRNPANTGTSLDQQVRRMRSSTPSPKAAGAQPTTGASEHIDLEKSPGKSVACPLEISDEEENLSHGQKSTSRNPSGDGEGDTQHSDTATGSKQRQHDDERRRGRGDLGPHPKRLALSHTANKILMAYETGKVSGPPPQQTPTQVAVAPAKHMTRRSHGASQPDIERGASESRSPVSSHSNDKVDSSHQSYGVAGAAAAASHKNDENLTLPKPRTQMTTTTANRTGASEYNLYGNTNGTTKSNSSSSGTTKELTTTTTAYQAPAVKSTNKAPYQNGTAQDQRGGYGRPSSESTTAHESPSTSSSSSRKSKSNSHHSTAPSSTSSPTPPNRQQQSATSAPANTTHYNPLKCMACKERLEDRHFVQCPSVVAHKFCFGCSKISIERQQAENKNLKGGLERIFCPSGKRCHLASEQTPWTFMNSEIETIIRESSRQTTSLSSATGAPGGGQPTGKQLNGLGGNGAPGDYQISTKPQRQQPADQQPAAPQQNGHSKQQNNLTKIS